jgi:hypothetical protein
MKNYTIVNGQNYFNEISFNEMVKKLQDGETIAIYIDCIGHARTSYETAAYVEALKQKFGNNLQADNKTTFTTLYSLKRGHIK